MPLRPERLRQALGEARVNQWARQIGMDPTVMLAELARVLPQTVSRLASGSERLQRMLAAFLRGRNTP
ncbi:hypothetical protein [Elioraea sp.]|uniref:hypothetical protein n=1 Tax=Elioraea sp. TaxID=2185103 RepID=UPI003F70B336